MSVSDIIYVILLVIFVMLSAYFAASEIAFISLQRYKLENMIKNNVKNARLVAWFKDRPEKFLSTFFWVIIWSIRRQLLWLQPWQ